jgi:hypothetical protein
MRICVGVFLCFFFFFLFFLYIFIFIYGISVLLFRSWRSRACSFESRKRRVCVSCHYTFSLSSIAVSFASNPTTTGGDHQFHRTKMFQRCRPLKLQRRRKRVGRRSATTSIIIRVQRRNRENTAVSRLLSLRLLLMVPRYLPHP